MRDPIIDSYGDSGYEEEFTPEQRGTIEVMIDLLHSTLGTEENPVRLGLIIVDNDPVDPERRGRVRYLGGTSEEETPSLLRETAEMIEEGIRKSKSKE